MADKKHEAIVKNLAQLREGFEGATGQPAVATNVSLGHVLNDVGKKLGLTKDQRRQVVGPSIPEEDL